MKIYLKSVLFVLMLAFISCDKDGKFENNLEGSWELRHLLGGQIAGVSPDYPSGNGRIIKFEGSTYQEFFNGAVVSSGTFILISSQIEIDGTKYSYKLDFDNKMKLDTHIKLSGKTLKMAHGSISHDGNTLTYAKL